MVHVFVRHNVEDYNRWKESFDKFAQQRRAGGEKTYRIAKVNGEPNNLHLSFEWENFEKARSFLGSEDLKERMRQAGVTEEPEILITEELTSGRP